MNNPTAETFADGQEVCPDGEHEWRREAPEPDVGIMSATLECQKCGFVKDDDGELDEEFYDERI